jgi:hypothetical protein
MIKPERVIWAGAVANIGDLRIVFKILVGKSE